MGLSTRWAGALAAVVVAVPLHAQEGRTAIAVLPFENGGSYGQDKEDFEALEVGLPAMLSATLAGHPGMRVIEGAGVQNAMSGRRLVAGRRVDATSATEVGRAAGARYAVTGSFADLYGRFRINARVVDIETGEIVKVVSNDDPKLQDRGQLAAIILLVSERIVAAVGQPPLPADAAARRRAIPTEALTEYSRGVMFDLRGDTARAAEAYRRALAAYPDYPEARAGLARTRGT